MTFTYLVRARIERTHKRDDDICTCDTYSNLFSDTDPFHARELAFKRAQSYREVFEQANAGKADAFFRELHGWYAEYDISVYFIDPDTQKEIELHNTISSEINRVLLNGENTYDPITRKQILSALKKEHKILTKHGTPKHKSSFYPTPFFPNIPVS